jgi:high-affinity nickel-transport protein
MSDEMTRPRFTRTLSRQEWWRLSGFGAAVAALHIAGWGLFVYYSGRYPAMAGLGVLAYSFGLRHAFDADHIAAIDNTTRKLLQQGKRPLGVGFFFSLGHSTIVFSLAAGLAIAARTVKSQIPALQSYGGTIGAGVSGTFLWIIGVLNLIVLLDIVRIYSELKRGEYDQARLEERLQDRGFMNRFFLGRFFKLISKSWQMYPLGILFGLGFDTATEVGLLALAAGVASHAVPFLAVLSLPILFAAGMSLMDTADGAFMSQAYGWAFSNPIRKVYYNITVTSLSVTVALAVGSVELLQVFATKFGLDSGFWGWLNALDFENLGYGIVGLFIVTWAGSVVIWKTRRIDERWGKAIRATTPK